MLDEGVPANVGTAFQSRGHLLIPFEQVVQRGSIDTLVCTAAQANDAILVAFDKDMKRIAQRNGIAGTRFSRLNLIKFCCPEPVAAARLSAAMSFLEHEWAISDQKASRRLHVEIGKNVLRTHR